MIKVAIFGGSGYTGFELLRILALHHGVKVTEVTSRQYRGKALKEVFPSLAGYYDGTAFSDPDDFKKVKADISFVALPHGASQEVVPGLLDSGGRVIDLSADFRIRDPEVYKAWYAEHKAPELLKKAVYGLPEINRDCIKGASLVANPGCYPTGAILALAPLAKMSLIEPSSIIVDSKSGASGAGRGASLDTSFVEVAGGFKAYKVGSHRHTPEIEQETGKLLREGVSISFTPHLLPVSRGILTTVYVSLKDSKTADGIHALYTEFYSNERFVRVMPSGRFPDISQVRGSNYCDIGVYADGKKKKAIIVCAIDNLVKGASGQAVQNMNIISGFEEHTALLTPPLSI